MSPRTRRTVPLTLAAAALAGVALAQDADVPSKPAEKAKIDLSGVATPAALGKAEAKPATTKAERAPFKVEATLKGVFESPQMTEVQVKPEAWGTGLGGGFQVVTAVEPGTVVKKGDVLVTFDTEKIDRALRDLEAEQQLAELTIKMAELDLPILERTTPLDLAAAERSKERADEDLRKFLAIDKPLSIESAEFSARNSRNNLEYVEEELKQLEKMYRSKDLTEETEEIILKRQRNQVEMAKFMVRQAENRRDQVLKVELPRREQDMKDGVAKAAITFEKAKNTLPLGLNQKKLALEKAKFDRTRAVEKLTNLRKDRALFTVKAPADGVVYYGRCVQGNWPTAPGLLTKLQKGGTVSAEEVFMTVVQSRPLVVRAQVEEKDLALVPPGAPARVTPAALPETKLAAKVEKVGTVPIGGSFEVRLALDPSAQAVAQVVPGMSCQVKVTAYAKDEAVVVPAVAVFPEGLDEDKYCVYRYADGKPQKQMVVVGKRSAGKAEILTGLNAGDEILLAKP